MDPVLEKALESFAYLDEQAQHRLGTALSLFVEMKNRESLDREELDFYEEMLPKAFLDVSLSERDQAELATRLASLAGASSQAARQASLASLVSIRPVLGIESVLSLLRRWEMFSVEELRVLTTAFERMLEPLARQDGDSHDWDAIGIALAVRRHLPEPLLPAIEARLQKLITELEHPDDLSARQILERVPVLRSHIERAGQLLDSISE